MKKVEEYVSFDSPNHFDLANYILYRANKMNKPLTVLHLNKAWYFTLGYLVDTQEVIAKSIFKNSELEAWVYGAVPTIIHEKYKYHKSTPIFDKGEYVAELDRVDLNTIIDIMIKSNPQFLVDINKTHPFWKNNKNKVKKGEKPKYKYKDLIKAFKGE